MIVHQIEQRTDEWYSLRLGKPTASEFSKLVTSKGEPSKQLDGYALTLAGELYAGKSCDKWDGNQWTERGREMEAQALSLYAFAHDVEPETVGFITDDDERAGCSPDALIGDDGMLEIKCLKAERHIAAILYHEKHRRCPTDYVQQAQGQMMIAERQWCDLVFYHPEFPLLTIRQEADSDMHKAISAQIDAVCERRDEVLATLKDISEKEAA